MAHRAIAIGAGLLCLSEAAMTQFNEHESPRQLNRALPGWAVDAILFGLPGRDRRDSRRVCGKCVSIAMSLPARP
jgi:hypothetical protein